LRGGIGAKGFKGGIKMHGHGISPGSVRRRTIVFSVL
jgi:hypothetical protein